MARRGTATKVVAAVPAILVAPVVATGILYLVRDPTARLPGPRVPGALPLDALAQHGAVAILAFALVWAAVSLVVGSAARSLSVDRLAAALVLALGVGAWLFVLDTFSVYVTNQIPVSQAMAAAVAGRAVYLAAGAVCAGGALLGLPAHSRRTRAPFVLAVMTAAAGVADMVSALVSPHTQGLVLARRLTQPAHPVVASAAAVAVGAVLIAVAWGLARRNRRAWTLAVVGLAASSVYQLTKGLDAPGAFLTGMMAILLVARRDAFDAAGDPESPPRAAVRAGLVTLAIVLYASFALSVHQALVDRPVTAGFVVEETARALAGLTLTGSHHVAGDFGRWFPLSVLLLGVFGLGWTVSAGLAPWRYRLGQESRQREVAHALFDGWGRDTFAPFSLREDKSLYFSDGGTAFLAYRVVMGVALVTGDPIGPPDQLEGLIREFLAFARARGWHVAVLGVPGDHVHTYRSLGLRVMYEGGEAVIDAGSFSLEGRSIRKVRQAVHRLERAGYTSEVLHAGDVGLELRRQLEDIALGWQGGVPARGFSMELDALFTLRGRDALFVIGRAASGTPEGFLHFAVLPAGRALSLSTMPRLRATPNGFNEWLICQSVNWAREHGVERLSLNFSPFAGIMSRSARLSGSRRIARTSLLGLKGLFHFQLDNLFMFNDQFHPRWEPRYVAYEHVGHLPRVGIATLAAEGYLRLGRKAVA